MQVGDFVTIHTYGGPMHENAIITSEGWDQIMSEDRVFTVWHPGISEEVDFYQTPDRFGNCSNVGNAAIWIEETQA